MRNFSPREKSTAICDGQASEDGDLPQNVAERFLKKPSELEIQAKEWKTVPWVWEKFCNISDLFTLSGLKFWKAISFTREGSKRNLNLGPEFSVGAVRKWSSLSASFSHPLTKYACVLLWQRAEPWARSDARPSSCASSLELIIDLESWPTATATTCNPCSRKEEVRDWQPSWLCLRQELAPQPCIIPWLLIAGETQKESWDKLRMSWCPTHVRSTVTISTAQGKFF